MESEMGKREINSKESAVGGQINIYFNSSPINIKDHQPLQIDRDGHLREMKSARPPLSSSFNVRLAAVRSTVTFVVAIRLGRQLPFPSQDVLQIDLA